mmetsp:Transcript_8842/g.18484  ORF Transcript_8842/g.18484 Transcript_8842/m.18484 type:complete len:239 (+) Transcript_8842:305-1021(+)
MAGVCLLRLSGLSSQFRIQGPEQSGRPVFVPDLGQYPSDLVLLVDLPHVEGIQKGQDGKIVALVRRLGEVQQRRRVGPFELQNRQPDVLRAVPRRARDRRGDRLELEGEVPLVGKVDKAEAVDAFLRRFGQHVGGHSLPVVAVEPDGGAEVDLGGGEFLGDLPVEEVQELLGGAGRDGRCLCWRRERGRDREGGGSFPRGCGSSGGRRGGSKGVHRRQRHRGSNKERRRFHGTGILVW